MAGANSGYDVASRGGTSASGTPIYGRFNSTSDQLITLALTPQPVTFENIISSNGCSIELDTNSLPSIIKVSSVGMYHINFSLQPYSPTGGIFLAYLQKNGVPLYETGREIVVNGDSYHILNYSDLIPFDSVDDEYQIMIITTTSDGHLMFVEDDLSTDIFVIPAILSIHKI